MRVSRLTSVPLAAVMLRVVPAPTTHGRSARRTTEGREPSQNDEKQWALVNGS